MTTWTAIGDQLFFHFALLVLNKSFIHLPKTQLGVGFRTNDKSIKKTLIYQQLSKNLFQKVRTSFSLFCYYHCNLVKLFLRFFSFYCIEKSVWLSLVGKIKFISNVEIYSWFLFASSTGASTDCIFVAVVNHFWLIRINISLMDSRDCSLLQITTTIFYFCIPFYCFEILNFPFLICLTFFVSLKRIIFCEEIF